jgi:hypothetical protein
VISQTLDVPQHQSLSKLYGQSCDKIFKLLCVGASHHLGFRVESRRTELASLFDPNDFRLTKIVQPHKVHSVLLFEPSIRRIADYREQPRARIEPGLLRYCPEGTNARLLQHVIGIVPILRKPARKCVRVRQIRLDQRSKPGASPVVNQIGTSLIDSKMRQKIPAGAENKMAGAGNFWQLVRVTSARD